MKSFRSDLIMGIMLVMIVVLPQLPVFNGIEVFRFWHYLFIAGGYGGYITLRLFVMAQTNNAKKKNLMAEYDEINRIEKHK